MADAITSRQAGASCREGYGTRPDFRCRAFLGLNGFQFFLCSLRTTVQIKPEIRLPLRECVPVGGPEERCLIRAQYIVVVVKSVVVGVENRGVSSVVCKSDLQVYSAARYVDVVVVNPNIANPEGACRVISVAIAPVLLAPTDCSAIGAGSYRIVGNFDYPRVSPDETT